MSKHDREHDRISFDADVQKLALLYFGINRLYEHQLEAVWFAVHKGYDGYVCFATGGGKSLVMWLTAVMMHRKLSLPSLIIVPTISLLQDHLQNVSCISVNAWTSEF